MTLIEFIDDNFTSSDIKVLSSDGKEVGTVLAGDEDTLALIRDYAHGEVVSHGEAADGSLWAYVKARPVGPAKPAPVLGYPGEVSDEAQFSLDWRSREPKASPKQASFLLKNIGMYRLVKKPQWPDDPTQLLRYEVSDAMTAVIEAQKGRRKGES